MVLGEKDNNTQVKVPVTDIIEIELFENPTTGYKWAVQLSNTNLQHVDSVTPAKTGQIGEGRIKKFIIKAAAKGTAKIQFYYSRPWQKNVKPLKYIEYTVQIV